MVKGRKRIWARMLGTGLMLWLFTVITTYLTANPTLVPTLVLLGSFLVPVAFVAWAFERRTTGEITAALVFQTFVVGGVLGVLAASLLESYLLRPSATLFLGVGFIEEAVKLAALAVLTRELKVKTPQDGMILGACVGLGFAAFESAGYALMAALTEQGLSLVDLVVTELVRGLATPFGHGLWTAILGGVLFSRSGRESFLLTGRLFAAYLGVSLLHALWDSVHSIAVLITVALTEPSGWSLEETPGWISDPSSEQVVVLMVLTWSGLAVVALIGVGWLGALISIYQRPPRVEARGYPISTRGRWWPGGQPPPR
jgi:protease PrsW